jgi:steroid delta-isomerase-like uncharacterized protein
MAMQQNEVMRFAEQFAAAYNTHDVNRLLAMYADDAEVQVPDQPEPLRGRTAVGRYLQAQFDGVPDVHVELTKVLVDRASFADEGIVTGTNTGSIPQPTGEPLPATGKALRVAFAEFVELADSKVRRQRLYWDQMAFLNQLGLLDIPQAVRT